MFEKELAFIDASRNYFGTMEDISRKASVLEILKKDPASMSDLQFFDWVNSASIGDLEEFGSGKWRWLEKHDDDFEVLSDLGDDHEYADRYYHDANWVDGEYSPKLRPEPRPYKKTRLGYHAKNRAHILQIAPGFNINLGERKGDAKYVIAQKLAENNFLYCFFEIVLETVSLWRGSDFCVITTEDTYFQLRSLFLHIQCPWVYGEFMAKVITGRRPDIIFIENDGRPYFAVIKKSERGQRLQDLCNIKLS